MCVLPGLNGCLPGRNNNNSLAALWLAINLSADSPPIAHLPICPSAVATYKLIKVKLKLHTLATTRSCDWNGAGNGNGYGSGDERKERGQVSYH